VLAGTAAVDTEGELCNATHSKNCSNKVLWNTREIQHSVDMVSEGSEANFYKAHERS
jgi:hypothetical protein